MFAAVSALALSLLFAFAPPQASEAPSEVPVTHREPPPPTIDFPPPTEMPREQPGSEVVVDDRVPPGTTPPGEAEAGGVVIPDPSDPEDPVQDPSQAPRAPLEWDVDERTLESLPYAPTAARKSAVRRGNDVLIRPFRKPVYSVAAAGRVGVLIGGGRDVIQPIAWGVAMQLRVHFLRVVKSRFGIELHAGHNRWQQREDFEVVVGEASKLTRISLLTHTDISLGPSLEIPIGPVFLQFGVTGGFAVSTLSRARSSDPSEDERISEVDGLIRGGLSLGIPIANRQGLAIGAAAHQVFSNREVFIDPNGSGDSPKTSPFGAWIESFLAYQVWF